VLYRFKLSMVMRSITKVPPNSRLTICRAAVVAFVLVALTGSLTTRVFHATIDHSQSVQSSAAQAMRQHMDQDALRWTAPVVQHAVLDASAFYQRVVPAGSPVPALLLEKSLYNRPPPSC